MYFSQRSPPYNHVQLQSTISSSTGKLHSPLFKQYFLCFFSQGLSLLILLWCPTFTFTWYMQKPVAASSKAATTITVINSHVWLVFERGYDKMKHGIYNLCQNTNMVILIETIFYKHKWVHFLFLLQKHDLSVIWCSVGRSDTSVVVVRAEFF